LTTTDPELKEWVRPDWGAQRVGNLYGSFQWQLRDILRKLGLKSIAELRGRRDLLRYIPEEFEA
jgi:glutamate synthase domain-containing protein 2